MEVKELSKGDIVKGEIIRIEGSQAIVNVGYKYEGVIPGTELSVVRVEQASEVVSVGEQVECKVLRISDEEGILILSKKEAASIQAWDRLQQLFEAGTIIEIQVADVVKGGLVVDVGVRAFLPASLLHKHYVEDLNSYRGQKLRVKIVELNQTERKVILSHKAVTAEDEKQDQQQILKNIQVGEVRTGTVQRLTPFGVFVDIGGVDGLVHVSELSWNRVENPETVVSAGQEVKVKVLKIDPEKGKISLSIKEAGEGPWSLASSQFKTGNIVKGTVRRLAGFGAFVELLPGIEGLVHVSQIASHHVTDPKEVLSVGEEVQVKILEVNPEAKRISLSIKEAEGDRTRREIATFTDQSGASQGTGATIGELFGDLLKTFNTK